MAEAEETMEEEVAAETTTETPVNMRKRKTLRSWMDSFKTGLIDLFREEEEKEFK